MAQTIGFDESNDQRDKTIQILAARDTGAFALIDLSYLDLLLSGFFPMAPESFDGLYRLCFVIRQIKCHDVPSLLFFR